MTRMCPIPGCPHTIRSTRLLMCPSCWVRVPNRLQREVNKTWSAIERGVTTAAYEKYKAARQAAIEAVTKPVAQASQPAGSGTVPVPAPNLQSQI